MTTFYKFSDSEKNAILSSFESAGKNQKIGVHDSLGAFYINQLELLDPIIYKPLVEVSWSRDVQLRSDVTWAAELLSYRTKAWGLTGNTSGAASVAAGKALPYIGINSNTAPEISENYEKSLNQMYRLGYSISYSDLELESAAMAGVNLDSEKFDSLQTESQMHVDQVAYIGDVSVGSAGIKGLLNNASVSAASVAGGTWATKTADEIVADVSSAVSACYANAGFSLMPNKLLLPPAQYMLISYKKVSDAGNISVLEYLKQKIVAINGMSTNSLEILPCKWLVGRGASAADRMMLYTNDSSYVRFPHLPLRGFPPVRGMMDMKRAYAQAVASVEFIRPQTAIYRDGI